MKNKKVNIIWAAISLAVLAVAVLLLLRSCFEEGLELRYEEAQPIRGDISISVSTTGTVKPQNRLEIKPPINGRVERISVDEGEEVKTGEVLALMSSTERATLIDAARLKGKSEYEYWRKAYKETPLIAPIDGVVIVRSVEPGQTVTTSDAVLVLSDRLIVEADCDESDMGEVKVGQRARIGLDAYPGIEIDAVVDEISYESEIVNNVTIYKVDILPEAVPEVFRSGMSANVEIIVDEAKDAVLIPQRALLDKDGKFIVFVKDMETGESKSVVVEVGLQDEASAEIRSGLTGDEIILVPKRSFVIPKKDDASNPFMPRFRRSKK